MKWFVERGMLGAAFALALIILISVSWLSYTNTRNLIETGDWVTQTHESLENLESVLALLNTIQSAQRGFVLTGEESYLAPYRDSTSLLEGQLAILSQRVSDNPDQSQRFERLKPLLIERISLADEIIEVRRSAGFDAALKIVETDRGKEMTDQIRQLIGEMRKTEIRILTVRDSQSKAQARQSILTLAVGSSLSFVLLVLVFYFLNREVASRKRAEASLLEQSRLMELILNSTGEGIVVADETGRMILFNPAAERLLGVGLTDKAPEEWTEIYGVYCSDGVTPCPPEDLPLAKAMHGIEVDNVELFLRNPRIPDGVWVTVIGRPLIDDKGNSYGGVVAFHDTTLRKQAENSLQKYADDIRLC